MLRSAGWLVPTTMNCSLTNRPAHHGASCDVNGLATWAAAGGTICLQRRGTQAKRISIVPRSVPELSSVDSIGQRLPIGTRRGKKLLQYVWDGARVQAIEEEEDVGRRPRAGPISSWAGGLMDNMRRALLPNSRDVTPDYWDWLKWRLCQRLCSSTMQNFSTQALLTALGLGATRTFTASAAINWLLKDGVGRLARLTVATKFAQSFDADLKRLRFVTSLVFTVCIGCEFATPFFPQFFLLLASIANIGKSIGLSAFIATSPAFQQALCTGANLADLTAKSQAQHMIVDMISLALSAAVTYGMQQRAWARIFLPLGIYLLCAAGDLFCIYHELKSIELRSLNRERAEMLVEHWLDTGEVATAAMICASERLLAAPEVCSGVLPLSIVPMERIVTSPARLTDVMLQHDEDHYMLVAERAPTASTSYLNVFAGLWSRRQPQLLACVRDNAKTVHYLGVVLEAGYIRQVMRGKTAAASAAAVENGQGMALEDSGRGDAASSATDNGRDTGFQNSGQGRTAGGPQTLNVSSNGSSSSHSPSSDDASSSYSSPSHGSVSSSTNGLTSNTEFLQRGVGLPAEGSARGSRGFVGLVTPSATRRQREAAVLARAQGMSDDEWRALLAEAHEWSAQHRQSFLEALKTAGWETKVFLLSTSEKVAYVMMKDRQ